MEKRLLTVEEVAEVLNVSKGTVYNLFQAGALPGLKLGRSRRVSVEDLDAYLARLRGEQGAAA